MREIKFRAWDNACDTMYPNIQNHINDEVYAFGNMLNNPNRFKIDQFTGLKDKNGKEIYEGDIVKVKGTQKVGQYITKVIFRVHGFCIEENKTKLLDHASLIGVEVIGNIHENPELL